MEQDHMLPEEPPSYTQSHDPQSLDFPTVPSSDPQLHHERILPPLQSAPIENRFRQDPVNDAPFTWPSSNPLTAYYQPGPSQLSPKNRPRNSMDSPSMMDIDMQDRNRRGVSVLSIDKDDMDVRIAAEALGELRADFIQSPPQTHSSLPTSSSQTYPTNGSQQPEPLLSLLTTSHPLIGTAIGGSLSAYSASKNYSPRFKSGAEYVERRFTPVVNTVGSVGRLTGVEGGVRWFLGGRHPSHHHPSDIENHNEVSHKRRKLGTVDREEHMHDLYNQLPTRQRRASHASTVDSLPAYDDQKSPLYTATSTTYEGQTQTESQINALPQHQNQNQNQHQALIPTTQPDCPTSPSWQSRLVLSTSGLSVAMSDESLRSLKYCLSWLRWANEHISKVIHALQALLDQYSPSSTSNNVTWPSSTPNYNTNTNTNSASNTNPQTSTDQQQQNGQLILHHPPSRPALHAKIAALKSDVLKTLKEVIDIVSKYAGGALPENARDLVRKHLTSLPQRFRVASVGVGRNENGGDHAHANYGGDAHHEKNGDHDNHGDHGNGGSNGGENGGEGNNRSDEKENEKVIEGAMRVMVLAREGLDMMAQVAGVVEGTVISAEEWCERLGRKRREEEMGAGMGEMRMDTTGVDGIRNAGDAGMEGIDITTILPPVNDGKDIDGAGFPRMPITMRDQDVKTG